MRYLDRYPNGRDEVKVAVLADQMQADRDASFLSDKLFWGLAAAVLAFNLFLTLH